MPTIVTTNSKERQIVVTGATGYIGGRLVRRLLERGDRVCCLVRSARKAKGRIWSQHPKVTVHECDLEDPASFRSVIADADAAYYLVHSMVLAGSDYAEADRILARSFAGACEEQKVGRIIYLGGLGETGDDLSEHLDSRREVEHELASTSVPVTVLRAAMIIGSGSASFEILRYLVERLPVMVTPRWVKTECQPIAVRDVLRYLVECLEVEETRGATLDVGGASVSSYRTLMEDMAAVRKLRKRIIIPVPVLTPRLSSLWIHLVTPLDRRIARPLAEGLRNRVVCRNDDAVRLMPGPLFTAREAIAAAESRIGADDIETSWSDAGVMPGDPDWAGGKVFVDRRTMEIDAPAKHVFTAVCRVGGGHGWYAAQWLWRVRGWMDKMIGGPGLRRGRRAKTKLAVGDALDFWRVVEVESPRQLTLRAEMKLPGEASLEFEVRSDAEEGAQSTLIQTARFKPKGLAGLAYWYAVLPLHGFVFRGMQRGIRRSAEAIVNESVPARRSS